MLLAGAVAGLVALEAELVSAEERLLQPATRLGARHRVVEQADDDTHEQQELPAAVALTPSLEAVRGLAQLADRGPQVLLDLVVARDPRGDIRDAARRDELVVDLTSSRVGLFHVLAELFVVQRALHVRFRSTGDAGHLVFGPGHAPRPFGSS